MNLITKTIGVTFAAVALCGVGAATAFAATPAAHHAKLGDPEPFRVDLLNNTTSPLQITGYQGSDWDTADGTPAVGTVLAKNQEIGIFLYSEGGASDSVSLKPTNYAGHLGIGITQDHIGGQTEQALPGSTLNVNVRGSGDGYNILAISNPGSYSTETIRAFSAGLNALQSIGIPAYTCPADHPWLVNQGLAPGRIVPNGVSVDEPGSIGVTIPSTNDDSQGLANGWQSNGASATNWDLHSHDMIVYAHCTNDPGQVYQG